MQNQSFTPVDDELEFIPEVWPDSDEEEEQPSIWKRHAMTLDKFDVSKLTFDKPIGRGPIRILPQFQFPAGNADMPLAIANPSPYTEPPRRSNWFQVDLNPEHVKLFKNIDHAIQDWFAENPDGPSIDWPSDGEEEEEIEPVHWEDDSDEWEDEDGSGNESPLPVHWEGDSDEWEEERQDSDDGHIPWPQSIWTTQDIDWETVWHMRRMLDRRLYHTEQVMGRIQWRDREAKTHEREREQMREFYGSQIAAEEAHRAAYGEVLVGIHANHSSRRRHRPRAPRVPPPTPPASRSSSKPRRNYKTKF